MYLRYAQAFLGGALGLQTTVPSGWFHVVYNYIGPNNGEGVTIYHDGVEEIRQGNRSPHVYPAGSGKIVIGRTHPSRDQKYASLMMDELMFFNRKLTVSEIQILYNQYT